MGGERRRIDVAFDDINGLRSYISHDFGPWGESCRLDQAMIDAFAELTNQKITEATRMLWYPEIEIERYADKHYVDEGGEE